MGHRVVFILCSLFMGQGVSEKEKRILLSDPSYVQTQMDHMQSEIQDLIVKFNAQQTTIQNLNVKVNAQQANLTSQQATITSQQMTIKDLNVKVKEQQTNITSQQTSVKDLNVKVIAQSNTISNLENRLSSGKGVHFVRWGRKDCPGNYSLVYSGYAGGSHYTHTGAASEYVCMPPDPIWGPNKDVDETYTGFIYGAEYDNPALFKMSSSDDVPCAVCESHQYSSVMMIPGRTDCYHGWTEGYHGDLACGRYDLAASTQYVCVDQHPQALAGGGTHNDNGKLFNGVKAKCDPLRCPPYENDKHLSCVVCLK